MTTKTIYCSACDREVEVQLSKEGKLEGSVCMDIGEQCMGTFCPICAESPDEIRVKLNRLRKTQ